jgi:putative CocE/NonD family hydrolase
MIYKTMAIVLLSLFIFSDADSQQIYLPKKTLADSAVFSEYMPVMARQIIKRLGNIAQEKKDSEYYRRLFALQAIATRYTASNQSIDSLKLALKANGMPDEDTQGYLNIYSNFNHIKLMQIEGDKHSAIDLFKWSLPIVLSNLHGKAFANAVEPYAHSAAEIESEWKAALAKIQPRQNDSLSIDAAITFAQAYLKHLVYKPFVPIGKPLTYLADSNNFIVMDSTMIIMRDGVKLAAVIVRNKKAATPQPVVMIGNIYASTAEVGMAKDIVSRGYTGIILNTRGKYVSEAEIGLWEHDAEDMYDAIDWISKQSWCNGKIGMYGGSYLGFTQWAATKKMHPALKTIVPQVAAAPGIDFPMRNGVYSTYALRWVHNVTKNKLADWAGFFDLTHWNASFNKWYLGGQAFNTLDSVDGQPSAFFQKWLKHPAYDEYWQKMIPYQQEFSKINIPVLTITGYYDGDQKGALYYYKQHHLYNPAANHYLVIGPYDHGGAQGSPTAVVNGYTIDKAAKIDITQLVFDWFDFTLKGGKRPALLTDTVNYQVMGTNQWSHAPSLKKLNNKTLNFYLSTEKDGKLNKLTDKKTGGYIPQTLDFSKREITKIADTFSLFTDSINSNGVPTYISGKLENDVIIAGSFTGNLAASINKKDMDVVVAVTIQQPDGKYFFLTSTIQRASYAKSNSQRTLLKPGVKETIPVTGNFISKKILKGSKIIVQVFALKSVTHEINYGTGKDVATETIADAKEPLQIKWYGDSLIRLPVVGL